MKLELDEADIKRLLLEAVRKEYPGATSVSFGASQNYTAMDQPLGTYTVSAVVTVGKKGKSE